MIEQDNPFKLTPEKNQKVFESVIKPDLVAKTKAVEQPVFVLIGGQPGAGKSRVTAGVKNDLENNAIVLDADLFRPKHPNYGQMVKQEPLKVFELAREDVNVWLKQAGDFAIKNKRNVIMDGTLRDKDHTAKLAEMYRKEGYKVELNIVATHERNSHTSTFDRYERGLASANKNGRYVEPAFHKAAYEAIPKTVQHLEENKLIDQVKICSRNGEVLYENNLVNGEWEKDPAAVKALNKERDREPTQEETQWLEKQRENILKMMDKRNAPSEEVDKVKQQFQDYPIPGREKIQQQQHDSELNMQKYVAQPDRVYTGEMIGIDGENAYQEISPGVAVEHQGLAGALRQDDIGKRFTIAYDSQGGVSITQEQQLDRGNEIER